MKFVHVLNRLTGSPWFITEDGMTRVTQLLESRLSMPMPMGNDGDFDDDDDDGDGDDFPATPGVGVVPINGTLGNHLSQLEQSCGGVDYGVLVDNIRDAAFDPSNLSVLLHFQICPGGMANGCPEAFAAIKDIRAQSGKPFVSLVTGMACSGGYYLATAADTILVTETAMVGSIGVMRSVEDRSQANANAGIKRFTITTARMKDIGNPDRPPTDEEMTVMQSMAQQIAQLFLRDVKGARPNISAEVFDTGLPYYGASAVALGLADAVVPGFDQVIASMAPIAPPMMPMGG